jgi:lipopolysaccharide export system protein LptA
MIPNRKFKIWLNSFIAVLLIFLFYRIFGNIGIIKVSKTNYQMEQTDMNGFASDSNAGRVGQAKIEYVQRARFETVDQKTRKLKRVVGFEKVLHKTGDEWELDKPYMNVFQDNLRCNITAQTGTVEIENVEGANPTPKQATLKGNVIVHVIPQGKNDGSDSFIYLKEVTYDSDRSMLWSDNDVNYVSADADMMGKGLEIVFNSVTNKMEYLKIRKVDYLNIKKLVKVPGSEVNSVAKTSPTAEKAEKSAPSKQAEPVTAAAKVSEPCGVPDKTIAKKEDNYQCQFKENVVIEYKDEVVLADEIAITNLLFAQKGEQPLESQPQPQSKSQPQSPQPKSQTPSSQKQTAQQTPVIAEDMTKAEEMKEPPAAWRQKPVIAKVRCDGPMIVKPSSSKLFDDFKPAKFKGYNQLGSELLTRLGQRNVLIGQQVGYDIAAQTANATGMVELVFYSQMDTAKGRKKIPFIISAKKGAQFIVPKKEATFFGDVKGKFVKQTASYDEENYFYGSKLITQLVEKRGSKDIMGASDVSHITVLGPNVRLESIKTLDKVKLSHVRLKSERIDYDKATEDVIATGKGKIEYNSTAGTTSSSPGQKSSDKPCYALVEGFTKLVWDTNTLQVHATSEKANGIHIGYLPVLATGGYGPRITIDTKQIDVNYYEPVKGKAQLKNLNATGGIVYFEQNRYEFAGKELHYNAMKDFMTISGSPEVPCMLNGVFTDGIEYNLKTGEANSTLSRGVGVMPVR